MFSFSSNKQFIGSVIVATSILSASQVQALALGRLNVVSTQQQPLVMEIALAETEGVIPGAIRPSLASAGEFAVAGLDYQLWYQDIDVQVVQREGQLLLSLTSPQPVASQSIDLLVQVEYMGGRLLGQFAPQFAAPGSNVTPEPADAAEVVATIEPEDVEIVQPDVVAKPQVEKVAAENESNVEVAAQQLETIVEQVSNSETNNKQEAVVNQPVQVTVRAGQTLWRIAAENTPDGVNTWQALMAIYKTNTRAFKNQQITRVMAGAKLTIPAKEVMLSMTAGQAKAAYEQLVASYAVAKPAPTTTPAPTPKSVAKVEPKQSQTAVNAVADKQQQDKQIAQLNSSIQQLQDQSTDMQEKLSKLEQERKAAEQQAEELAKQNEALAAGLADQQSDLQTLADDKQALEKDLTALDQQVSATDLQLKDKQQQLQDLETELLDLQRQKVELQNTAEKVTQAVVENTAVSTPAPKVEVANANEEASSVAISKQLYPWLMGGLVVLLVGLVFSLLWRWLNRRPSPPQEHSEPPITDHSPAVVLDPLADHDARPSAQTQALHEAAERMAKHDQTASSMEQGEASFIEQLLQEQGTKPNSAQEDTLHLSAEVEALLQQQRQANDQRHEPHGHQNAEDAVLEKLDLARSYKQMGHVEEAQKLLQEVLHEGNLEQQTQATLLLSRMRQD